MTSTQINFFEVKNKILDQIIAQGPNGLPESKIFKYLFQEGRNNFVFDYRAGLTPDYLIESLLIDRFIIKICNEEFQECKFIASNMLK